MSRIKLNKLWHDDCGSGLLAAEWLFLFAILVLGIITGLIGVRQALISELIESAQGLMALNQSFNFTTSALGCPPSNPCPCICDPGSASGGFGHDCNNDLCSPCDKGFNFTAGSSASDITNTISEGSVVASAAAINQGPCD